MSVVAAQQLSNMCEHLCRHAGVWPGARCMTPVCRWVQAVQIDGLYCSINQCAQILLTLHSLLHYLCSGGVHCGRPCKRSPRSIK